MGRRDERGVPYGPADKADSTLFRDVCGKCGARRIDRQLGLEPTVEAYVARMVEVFRLVRRALADHGTCWLNVGDSYSGGGPHHGENNTGRTGATKTGSATGTDRHPPGIPPGNLCLVPQRLALALQADGWIVRSIVVWHKPAPMPASLAGWRWARHRIKLGPKKANSGKKGDHGHGAQANGAFDSRAQWADCPGCAKCTPHGGLVLRKGSWRPTSAWEPILMLAKRQGYFSDGEAVKTATIDAGKATTNFGRQDGNGRRAAAGGGASTGNEVPGSEWEYPAGANARDVQSWAAEPLSEKHYAAFPTALVSWCLRAGTSARGYCPRCGAPWARVVHRGELQNPRGAKTPQWRGDAARDPNQRTDQPTWGCFCPQTTIGWRPTCPHDDLEPRPPLVLDCFCGSGRTGIAAQKLCCDFVGIDLSPQYADMARRLLCHDMPLFARVEGTS